MRQYHCVPLAALLFQDPGDQIMVIIYEIDYNIVGLNDVSLILTFVDYHPLSELLVSYQIPLVECTRKH
ncbi:hypothetical protein NARC_10338 [Candidatus Nitrosocosmicus arcticus]|uniref:Uncharacterized protein n=1 Tax=Candidatus Nitrosocosmicus arcticus TaxID=2035267 RepID=A0A557SZA1_9ARCH|nr:hypothetical protein NARC_10338 [Candidatus Nitrosocosmicus arcticus]